MTKPKILITSAAGHTGAPAVFELLKLGFPVRAFVRRRDARSAALETAGAEIFAGDLFDYRDLRNALRGVQRAYYCPPFADNALHGAMLFAAAAEEARLEVVALMSAWNPHPVHPSAFTREMWMMQNVSRWMPSVDIIHVNPGIFAFTYFLGLTAVKQLGMLMLPFGDGLNAPPSNEDIAAVAAHALANPEGHIGKRYRPTGPRLISPQDVADIFGKVLDKKVNYQDIPIKMFSKAAKAQGFRTWEIAQFRYFAEELRKGAYAIGAPTDHVEQVCGRPPEEFEVTASRYLDNPQAVWHGFKNDSRLQALFMMIKILMTRAPDLDAFEAARGVPRLRNAMLAHENDEWVSSAEKQDLNLIHA
ncbi:MAG: NmrA family NAD(P)-binding protein [Thiotrichales bacterium]|nr:NmrA family NAD(P)-binding protein [Thiotrichales bacterium]